MEQRLRLALDAGHLGVWEWDEASGVIRWDATQEEICGYAPGTFPATFRAYVGVLHPEDRERVLATLAQAVSDGQRFSLEHRVVRPDGTVRWVSAQGQPVADGEVRGLVGVTQDVTDRHLAEEERARLSAQEARARARLEATQDRLEFLAGATATMNESLDGTERLRRLVRLGVPRIADASVVMLLDADGELRPAAVHDCDPDRQAALESLLRRYPPTMAAPVGPAQAVREQRAVWSPRVGDDLLARSAADPEHLAELRRLRITSGLSAPLVGPEGPMGVVSFATFDGRAMDDDQLALAGELCARVSTAVYNGQLLAARELERSAHRYQAALLQALFEASIDGMLAVGPDGMVLAHNQRFLELWGLDQALTSDGDEALLAAASRRLADPEGFVAGVREVYRLRPDRVRDEILLIDGRVLDRHGTPIRDADGEHLGFTWSFRDVTRERAQQAEVAAAGERFATLARTLQQSLLPPSLPNPEGIDLAARYHPAFEGVDVGGDFYDVFAVGQDWMLVIGDVCGKGPEAAALTALARYTVRAVAIHDPDPATTLAELNAAMLSHGGGRPRGGRFATVCCIRLRPAAGGLTAEVACGGHPLPVVLRADGSVEPGGVPGTLLGVFDEVRLSTVSTVLGPGDALVAVTDGVLEARDAEGRLWEVEGLHELLAPLAGRTACEVSGAIEARALGIQGGVARDDIAVLVARVPPAS